MKMLLALALMTGVVTAVPSYSAGAAPMSPPDGQCAGRYCAVEATEDEAAPPPPVVPPLDVEPAHQSPLLNALLAPIYQEAGFTRCPFSGLRRDDEADLAPIDIVRECDEEAEEGEEDAPPSWEEIVTLVSREFLRLPIAPSSISHQPEGDWALVNVDFIVMTDPAPQVFERELLGMGITFRAMPVHYAWDFGDGSPPLLTSSPGNPYPNQDVAHVYTSAADAVEVSLTTTWQGSFQINGTGPWLPVSGYATTTATAPAVEIVAMDVHLVPNP